MKYAKVVFMLLFLQVNGQTQWILQNPVISDDLYSIYFVDSLYGWIGSLTGSILYTTDGGNNWTINSDTSRGCITSLNFTNRLDGWAVTSKGKLLKTYDGGFSWNQNLSFNTFLYQIVFLSNGLGYIVASPVDINNPVTLFKTNDSGENWSPIIIPGLQSAASVKFINENEGYIVGGFPAKIFKTTDGAFNWELSKNDSLLNWFSAIDFKDNNNGLLGGFECGAFYRTTNSGEQWDEISLYVRNYYSIIYKENRIWLVVESGSGPYFIMNSIDDGINWFPQYSSIHPLGILNSFFINDSIGWAIGSYGKILKTINGGYSNPIMPLQPILEYPPDNFNFPDNNIWLRWYESEGSIFHLQIATDSLFNETVVSLFLPDNSIFKELQPETKFYLRLRTENLLGYSDWSDVRTFVTGEKLVGIENEVINNPNFYLAQNYPNPFNFSTLIEFSIPISSFTTLKVFDILGREMKTLISNELKDGNHRISLDASNWSSGIYIYRLSSSNKILSKKFILMK